MTQAKISAKLPESHGLTRRLADAIYSARAKGEPTNDLIVVGRLSPIGHAEVDGKQSVTFEIAALEVAPDSYEQDNVRDIITKASDARHGGGQLPLDFETRSADEQRRSLLAIVDDWAGDEGLSKADVAERWRSHWGIGDGEASPDGSFPHPDIDKAAPHHIREFALTVGALADEPVGDSLDDEDDTDDETAAES